MVAASKKKRGRPRVLSDQEQLSYETAYLFGSQRSTTNMHYVSMGSAIAVDAIGTGGLLREFNIGQLGQLGTVKGGIRKKGVLEQVGRMKLQDGYDDDLCKKVLTVALRVIERDGWKVKDVERWIRSARKTGVFFNDGEVHK